MKKAIFLMLTIFVFEATLYAQVNIGSTNPTHPSAVLEIESNNLGLLLPNVALFADSTRFALAGGDSITAIGMIVYNTANVQEGRGVYFWDGVRWHAIGLSRLQLPSPSPSPPHLEDENQLDAETAGLKQTTDRTLDIIEDESQSAIEENNKKIE